MGFVAAYALTIAIESVLLLLLLRKQYGMPLILRNAVIASSLTLPFVWFVFPALVWSWPLQIALSELFAFAAETAIYAKLFPGMDWKRAALVSFACNAASFTAGLVLLP